MKNPGFLTILLAFFFLQNYNCSYSLSVPEFQDTIMVYALSEQPVYDGLADDACWEFLDWHAIDQVWMPFGTNIDSNDFYGQYKIAWDPENNVLCFLLEVNDDTLSDAYQPGHTAAIFNFDMFEVFIDEDASGGYHVFDGKADNDSALGTNAENAFAYHILTKQPRNNEPSRNFWAEDLSGSCWEEVVGQNYRDHFPEFVCRRKGNVTTWEFSLKVFNDNYDPSNTENDTVLLSKGKVLGITLACNDDDDPGSDPKHAQRDNFIGSAKVNAESFNNHWKNADDFVPHRLAGYAVSTP